MEIKLLSCPLCLKPHFQGIDSLHSSLINVATSHLTCPVCYESLLGLDKLTIHLFTHIQQESSGNKEKEIRNKNEEEIDQSIISLDKSQNINMDKRIKCDICNFSFTDKTILDMHQKLLHQTIPDKTTGLYSYHCHLCSKKFRKRGSLMVHLRVAHYGFGHQIGELSEHIVDDIREGGNVEVSVVSPVQTKIQDNKQWECDICLKMFTTKYFLKKHKRLHTGEMPYICTQCNKSFTFQQSYHKHMLYHSSEKPYTCNECGRAFKELSTLQNHARIHSGERPFECDTCGKKFRQRVSYLVHQRIHTGVMPYKCTACNKSFRYKVSQRSHKCPINPPGSVIKLVETTEKIQKQEVTSNDSIKCIMSVDYSTGSINFIQNIQNDGILKMYLEHNRTQNNSSCITKTEQTRIGCNTGNKIQDVDKFNIKNLVADLCQNINDISTPLFSSEQSDLFSMVTSPLLSEVDSLCLTNSPTENTQAMNRQLNEFLHIINDESLK